MFYIGLFFKKSIGHKLGTGDANSVATLTMLSTKSLVISLLLDQ